MRPDYIDDWAELIVDYSLDIEDDDRFRVTFQYEGKPLAEAVIEQASDRGADVYYRLSDDELDRATMKHADDDSLTRAIHEYELEEAKDLDKRLHIRAPSNTSEMSDVPAEKQQAARDVEGRAEMREEMIENTTWSLTQYPTQALAQNAGMSTAAYENFVIDACVRDWEEERQNYMELKDIVDDGSDVTIRGDGTELSFSIDGDDGLERIGLLSDGTANVPGGEVFTTPEKHSFEGEIYFELPAMVDGEEVKGMHLEFGEDGQIVEYEAEKGEDLLEQKIETDEGSHYVGEFGIGTNRGIDTATKDILFDEKIGGTIHLAIGNAYRDALQASDDVYDDLDHDLSEQQYDELLEKTTDALDEGNYDDMMRSLSNDQRAVAADIRDRYEDLRAAKNDQQNRSIVHWDMIKDLRDTGELWIDDQLILEDGDFVGLEDL